MSQADGKHALERMELAYGNRSYKFKVNPQNIRYDYPQRQAVNKTQSAYVVQDFNGGVQEVEISGTTGSPTRGGEKSINELRNFLSDYGNTPLNYGNKPKQSLIFFNHTEDFAWYATLKSWSVERSVDKPLMWDYSIQLIVLGTAGGKVESKASTNDVTSWLYNKSRYTTSHGRNLSVPNTYAYIQGNVADGRPANSVMYSSGTGKTRAARTLGVF